MLWVPSKSVLPHSFQRQNNEFLGFVVGVLASSRSNMENQDGILAVVGGSGLCCGALGVFVGLGTPFSFTALVRCCKVWNMLLGWLVLFKNICPYHFMVGQNT